MCLIPSRERVSSFYLQPYDKDIMGKFLFDKEDIEGKKEALYTIWRTRRSKMNLTYPPVSIPSNLNQLLFNIIQPKNKNINVKGGILKQ